MLCKWTGISDKWLHIIRTTTSNCEMPLRDGPVETNSKICPKGWFSHHDLFRWITQSKRIWRCCLKRVSHGEFAKWNLQYRRHWNSVPKLWTPCGLGVTVWRGSESEPLKRVVRFRECENANLSNAPYRLGEVTRGFERFWRTVMIHVGSNSRLTKMVQIGAKNPSSPNPSPPRKKEDSRWCSWVHCAMSVILWKSTIWSGAADTMAMPQDPKERWDAQKVSQNSHLKSHWMWIGRHPGGAHLQTLKPQTHIIKNQCWTLYTVRGCFSRWVI